MREMVIKLNNGEAKGYEFDLGAKKLIFIIGKRGYLGCGYFDLSVASKLEEAAVIIKGVNSLEEMLDREISDLTPQAVRQGITRDMRGKEALERLI